MLAEHVTVLANRITYPEPATPSEQEGCLSNQWMRREQSERKGDTVNIYL